MKEASARTSVANASRRIAIRSTKPGVASSTACATWSCTRSSAEPGTIASTAARSVAMEAWSGTIDAEGRRDGGLAKLPDEAVVPEVQDPDRVQDDQVRLAGKSVGRARVEHE